MVDAARNGNELNNWEAKRAFGKKFVKTLGGIWEGMKTEET